MAITNSLGSTTTTIHRNLAAGRLHRRIGDVRYLWWWGRHGRAWWSSQYEDVEERIRRHQNMMMQRYSKALRRRSMWERADSPPGWSWRLLGRSAVTRMDRKAMSSTEQARGKLEEHENPNNETRKPWEEFHSDFESFKAAVDKAIERDPYGTLFGRRLRSPPSVNNSSWTSWSWIFDPKDIRDDKVQDDSREMRDKAQPERKESVPQTGENSAATSHTSSSSKTQTTLQSSRTATESTPKPEEEYIYDPISGRKVLTDNISNEMASPSDNTISQSSTPGKITPPRKGFLQTLFCEHGIDIPVKPYKPPKIYGYGGDETKKQKVDTKSSPLSSSLSSSSKKFESSRKSEYLRRRAATLGNAIDPTNFSSEFGAKYETEAEKVERLAAAQNVREKEVRDSPKPEDNVPLFSGTTYESKSFDDNQIPRTQAGEWLVKEGFSRKGLTIPSLQSDESFSVGSRTAATKIEPALDRTSNQAREIPVKIFNSKLQPSIDRFAKLHDAQSVKIRGPISPSTLRSTDNSSSERREDIDLLRASDVRAAARTARLTKQERETQKNEKRTQLEQDYDALQKTADSVDSSVPFPAKDTGILSQSLSNVWKHMKDYPQGIVARTMQSIGISYESEDVQTPNIGSSDLGNSRNAKDTASISTNGTKLAAHSVSNWKPSQPSQEALAEEKDREARDQFLHSASRKQTMDAQTAEARFRNLAQDLKGIYEAEHGQIDINHRQSKKELNPEQHISFRDATVKPGVVRDPEVERHVSEFEPRYADLVDKAKSIKRGLHEVSLTVGDIANKKAIAAIADRDLALTRMASKTVQAAAITAELADSINVESSKVNKNNVPKESNIITYDTPYVLLSFSKTTGDVEATPLRTLIGTSATTLPKANAVSILGSLENAAPFVKHFAILDKHGYELSSGGGEVLFFTKKAQPVTTPFQTQIHQTEAVSTPASTDALRKTIAAQENIAQPSTGAPTYKKSHHTSDRKAATVLDNLPAELPTPGPAAPTAPTISSNQKAPNTNASNVASTSISGSDTSSSPSERSATWQNRTGKVRRQEEVFSGQRRSTLASSTSGSDMATPGSAAPQEDEQWRANDSEPSFFRRFTRFIRRTILTAVAFGGGAYAIGVIAEAINAQAQIESTETVGPRRKIVMPASISNNSNSNTANPSRQRPGIFSTESSR